MHLLLLISVCLTIFSSGLLTLIFENKKIYNAICCFSGIFFAQVVLTYEILSVFSKIKPFYVILLNFIFFVIIFCFYKKYGKRPDFKKEIDEEYNKLRIALKNDKWLKYTSIAFLIFIFGSLLYMFFVPVHDEDAFSYHLARLPFWFEACNLNHFEIADVRALIMPINSEIFYFWAYSFIKSDIFVRIFSFLSYLLLISSLRGFLKELKIPFRLSLWAIFTVTSMHNIMFAITGSETNITIAAIILASLYLFMCGVKYNLNHLYFFASLLYALAIGTKTPALQIAPAFLFICTIISYFYKKNNFYKPLLISIGFIFINFIFFGSYNYVLNFLDFGNPLTSAAAAEDHSFKSGIQGVVANIIRYFSTFIDFSGFPFSVEIWRLVSAFSMVIIALLGIQPDINSTSLDVNYFEMGNNFDNMSGLGVLGFLLFIPALVIALKNAYKKYKSEKRLFLGLIAIGFFINILVLSSTLVYMIFSIRFVMMFAALASPVLIYMFYKKKTNKFKIFVSIIMIYSFTFAYYFYERRLSLQLLYVFYKNPSIHAFKDKIVCANIDFNEASPACKMVRVTKAGKKQPVNVLYFASSGQNIYFPKHSENEMYHVDFKLLETTEENDINWAKYDYILVPNVQKNSNIREVQKYRDAVILYNDGSDGQDIFYEFNNDIFANCIFVSKREDNLKWMIEPDEKITMSHCFYRSDKFRQHGFIPAFGVESFQKTREQFVTIYKNVNK